MGFLVAEQTTATTISDALTTLIDWVNVADFEDLRIIVENTGGGGGDPITDVQTDESADGIASSALDQAPGVPNVPITTGESSHESYAAGAWGTTYLRIRAVCAAGNDTTAKAWLMADTLSVDLDSFALTTLAKVKQYLGITDSTSDSILTQLINAMTDAIETYCGRKFKARSYTMERQPGNRTRELPLDNWPIISIERVAIQTEEALKVRCTDGGAYTATVSVTRTGDPAANTALLISLKGGVNQSDASLAYSSNATISDLAAAVTAETGWTGTVQGSRGHFAPKELVPYGSQECLSQDFILEVPTDWLSDYNTDHEDGILYRPGGWFEGFENIYLNYTAGYATIPADLEQVCIKGVASAFGQRSINPNLKSEKIGDYSYTNLDASAVQKEINTFEAELDKWRRIEYA